MRILFISFCFIFSLNFSCSCAKSKASKTPPNFILILSDDQLDHVLAIAALWIQQKNRDESHVSKFMPSGWTNGRLPNRKNVFEYEGNEYVVEYKQNREGNFIFSSNKSATIYSADSNGMDVSFNNKRHYSRVTLSKNKILVHMPYGDVMLDIKPRFVIPGMEVTAGGLVAPMPGKVIDVKVKNCLLYTSPSPRDRG